MIEVCSLSKEFPAICALRDVNFTVEQGTVCGLIGPNGAGKTTLLRILATLIIPTSGTARVAGFEVPREAAEIRKRIGYMPDTFGANEELTVDSHLEFFAHVYRLPRQESQRTIADLLALVDLVHLRNSIISRLSLGARQRLALGRVLLHNPEVLLLDEPVSGLDPRARVEMRELLRELGRMGKTVLISSHVLADLADLCDRLVILNQGKTAFSGSLPELKEKVMPDRTLEIAVEGDVERLREFLLRKIWVRHVNTFKQNGLEVVVNDPEVPLADISATLSQEDFRITRFLEREMDLEEAFLRITRESKP